MATPVISRPNCAFSATVRQGNADSCWKTIPIDGSVPRTGLPPTVTSPAVGSIRPPTISISVLLPQPLGPTIETNSPSPTSSETSCIASTVSLAVS